MRNKTTSAAASREHETPARRLHLVGTTDRETYAAEFDEPETANNQSELDSADHHLLEGGSHSEPEQIAKEIESAEDLVGVYLREMGVTPFYKWFEHDGVRGPNIATVYSDPAKAKVRLRFGSSVVAAGPQKRSRVSPYASRGSSPSGSG